MDYWTLIYLNLWIPQLTAQPSTSADFANRRGRPGLSTHAGPSQTGEEATGRDPTAEGRAVPATQPAGQQREPRGVPQSVEF